ncbi:hypothetical protein FF38_08356 [Lucilia cuprina]|uniref:Uncharacterized protein n=1 Tax=Lucilia cuprina TaxID=7375 RepID=A0A0L0BTI8_LUCCU|nr:hypothetical protein FF38_08356 [Lucilia cuprina]
MHSKHNFCRKDVQFINKNIVDLIYEPLLDMLRSSIENVEEELKSKILFLIEEFSKLFESLTTEYKLYENLKKQNLVEDLKEVAVEHTGSVAHSGEKNDTFLEMSSYMSKLEESNIYTNITQGEVWKKVFTLSWTHFNTVLFIL